MKKRDFVVVGRGMIGSAAAWMLAKTGAKVSLVGEPEPQDYDNHSGVFASHYDQARITRTLDPDLIWSELASRAQAAYAELERAGELSFFGQCGYLSAGSAEGEEAFLRDSLSTGTSMGLDFDQLTQRELKHRWDMLNWANDDIGLYQSSGGWINPRLQVQAAVNASRGLDVEMVEKCVGTLNQYRQGVEVVCTDGERIQADMVLLATGASTHALPLLKSPLTLRTYGRTLTLAEPDSKSLAAMSELPAIIYDPSSSLDDAFYLLPALEYPDGRYWLKMGLEGAMVTSDPDVQSLSALKTWFCQSGSPLQFAHCQQLMKNFLPFLSVNQWRSLSCVTTYTSTGYPYIGKVADRLAVSIGGCGVAAKSSLAIGEVAANVCLHNKWVDDLDESLFTPR